MIQLQMIPAAKTVVDQVLGLKAGEKVVLLTDTERPPTITQALAQAVMSAGAELVIATYLPTEMGGTEPPQAVAAAMKASDAVVNQTSHSITHTRAQREALAAGARVCNLRELDEDMMIRGGITADYNVVRRLTDRLVEMLSSAREARLTCPAGTDITMSLEGRQAAALAGFADSPGTFSGLPDGEAAIAPVEGSTRGVVVNPFMIEKINRVHDQLRITVEDGFIVEITGGREAQELKKILDDRPPEAANFAAELALGTNSWCRVIERTREVKKLLGQAHVAVGDNQTLGGTVDVPIHLDMIFLEPTVYLDGEIVLERGSLAGNVVQE